MPLVEDEMRRAAGDKPEDESATSTTGSGTPHQLVTSDGTYATQSAFNVSTSTNKPEARPQLRQYLMDGDFFIGASLASTLSKLALKYVSIKRSFIS